MRTLIIGGGHSAYFAANSIKEIDPDGKLIMIEFTTEKVNVLSKTFPFAEVILQEIDGVEEYIKNNGSILDAVVAATESDSLNLRYCKVAKESAIPLTISILNNPLNREIFLKEGITYIIDPYSVIPVELSEILGSPMNIIYKSPKDRILVTSIRLSEEKLLQKLRKELSRSLEISAIFVSQSGEITNTLRDIDLGGRVYLIGAQEKLEKILKMVKR
ncbi:MAG: NAD-binding protein [Thaumarchaeota archaeon]|nr:NAD-binding protein [Nitrososphaerota archaeon]